MQELRALAREEPVGSDAIVVQLAVAASAFCGGKISDLLVLSSKHEQTPDQMFELLKNFVNEEPEKWQQ
tara:strand:+ start:1094 stop:1300 length:207 start_codon:yes stop_codon:yes gene_type:complete